MIGVWNTPTPSAPFGSTLRTPRSGHSAWSRRLDLVPMHAALGQLGCAGALLELSLEPAPRWLALHAARTAARPSRPPKASLPSPVAAATRRSLSRRPPSLLHRPAPRARDDRAARPRLDLPQLRPRRRLAPAPLSTTAEQQSPPARWPAGTRARSCPRARTTRRSSSSCACRSRTPWSVRRPPLLLYVLAVPSRQLTSTPAQPTSPRRR